MITLAITWLSVALGLRARSVEAASNLPMPLILLPFLGSGFVPTDSMPAGLRWFAEYQPFTPFIETLRGLLMGTPIGNSAMLALAWCALLALTGYCWAMKLYNRDPARWARPGPPESQREPGPARARGQRFLGRPPRREGHRHAVGGRLASGYGGVRRACRWLIFVVTNERLTVQHRAGRPPVDITQCSLGGVLPIQ